MGDMGDYWRDVKDYYKQKERNWKANNMAAARNTVRMAPDGWVQHTEWHWSKEINGKRLDYWPSKDKFMYDGVVRQGGLRKFLKRLEETSNG